MKSYLWWILCLREFCILELEKIRTLIKNQSLKIFDISSLLLVNQCDFSYVDIDKLIDIYYNTDLRYWYQCLIAFLNKSVILVNSVI